MSSEVAVLPSQNNRRRVGSSFARIFCCCSTDAQKRRVRSQGKDDDASDEDVERTSTRRMNELPPPGGGRLSDDVYRKIRAVDQGTSTLTQNASLGLSARVLDRSEFRAPNNDIIVVQLIEIIKKPGQSLGLYLREGNGIDRPTGVFASRFGDNSQLERHPDVLRPGDEILSINNVEVCQMSIDDVVLILSIPRRLLLRIRFVKNKRDQMSSARSTTTERPVVVFHKVEERSDNDPGSASIMTQPTPTANTWLGKKARQQQEEMQRMGTMGRPSTARVVPAAQNSYSPRLLNGHAEPMSELQQRLSEVDATDTISRTARVPPPKIFASGTVRRTETFNSAPGVLGSPMYNTPRAATALPLHDYREAYLPRTDSLPTEPTYRNDLVDPLRGLPLEHDPLRSTMMPPPEVVDPLRGEPGYDPLWRSFCSPIMTRSARTVGDSKSNSLPRRRAISGPRNVKWRTDVLLQDDLAEDSDGAASAPEYSAIPMPRPGGMMHNTGTLGRTVNDIFSAAEYRNWAGPSASYMPMNRQTRWSHTYGEHNARAAVRNAHSLVGSPVLPRHAAIPQERPTAVLDRYHVSPLMNRRTPLRAAGPGINVDRLSVNSLTGILFVQILEGRGLKMPERQKQLTKEMYCVLEVDEQHRARTGVSTAEQKFRWRETFHIDVFNATVTHFFVYSWHPQLRHKLCHRGSLKLLEAFIVDQLNGDRMFALNLEPRGQLIVRIGFQDMSVVLRRAVNPRMDGVFGVPLTRLIHRERRDTPIVLTRLIHEIERRGVDYNGLYILCGAVEKKRVLRDELEKNPLGTELSIESVPDTNVLACILKDFLRELPEPLIPHQIHALLQEAAAVSYPNDVAGNRSFVLRAVDCLHLANKNCLILLMDHLLNVLASSPHNGLSPTRLTTIFAPLIFCSAEPPPLSSNGKETVRPMDVGQAAASLQMLLDYWPNRVTRSSESSSSPQSSQSQY